MAQHITIILPPPFHKGGRSCIAATPWTIPNPLTSLEVSEKAWESFIDKVFSAWARCTWGTLCDILVCATIVGIPFLYCKDDRALECARRSIEEHCMSDLNVDVRCSHTHVTEVAGVRKKLQVVFTPVYQYRGSIKYCFTSVTASSYLSHQFHRARNESLTQTEGGVQSPKSHSEAVTTIPDSAVPMSRQLQRWHNDSESQPESPNGNLDVDDEFRACESLHHHETNTEKELLSEEFKDSRDLDKVGAVLSNHIRSERLPPVCCNDAVEISAVAPLRPTKHGDGCHSANEKVTPCKLVLTGPTPDSEDSH